MARTSARAARNERVTGPAPRGRGPTSGVRTGRRDRARTLGNEEISRVRWTLTVCSHLAILPARSASTQDARRRLRSRTRAAPKNRTDVLRARRRSSSTSPVPPPPRASRELRAPRSPWCLRFASASPRLTARRVAFAGPWSPSGASARPNDPDPTPWAPRGLSGPAPPPPSPSPWMRRIGPPERSSCFVRASIGSVGSVRSPWERSTSRACALESSRSALSEGF